MKNKILYYTLIFIILTRISLYHEITIQNQKRHDNTNSISALYDESSEINAVQENRKVLLPTIEYIVCSLLIIFFVCLNKSNKINIETLKLDKRRQIYWAILKKIHGSTYKIKALNS